MEKQSFFFLTLLEELRFWGCNSNKFGVPKFAPICPGFFISRSLPFCLRCLQRAAVHAVCAVPAVVKKIARDLCVASTCTVLIR